MSDLPELNDGYTWSSLYVVVTRNGAIGVAKLVKGDSPCDTCMFHHRAPCPCLGEGISNYVCSLLDKGYGGATLRSMTGCYHFEKIDPFYQDLLEVQKLIKEEP